MSGFEIFSVQALGIDREDPAKHWTFLLLLYRLVPCQTRQSASFGS